MAEEEIKQETEQLEYKPNTGKNTPADENVNNDVAGIGDELEEDTLEEMKQMLVDQKKNFEKQIKSNEDLKVRFSTLWDIDEELWQMSLKGFKKLEPTFEFEKEDRYWELQTLKRKAQYESEKAQSESRIEHFDLIEKQLGEELDKVTKKLVELEDE